MIQKTQLGIYLVVMEKAAFAAASAACNEAVLSSPHPSRLTSWVLH